MFGEEDKAMRIGPRQQDLLLKVAAVNEVGEPMPKSHVIDRVYGAMQDYPEWEEVVRLGQEWRQKART